MLINTILDTEDFVHLYYPEDDVPNTSQGCGAGARMVSKYTQNRPVTPEFKEVKAVYSEMCSRVAPEPPSPRRASDIYPRPRLHCDEPDLKVPFPTICGEFVQYLGRTTDNGLLALSNYRLYVAGVSVPVRLIDSCEIKDLLHLHIQCKDGKTLRCPFSNSETCSEWSRRLSTALAPSLGVSGTFAAAFAAYARDLPRDAPCRRLFEDNAPTPQQRFRKEVERLGFLTHSTWRVTAANAEYKLCPSYPPLLIVPASVDDEDLDSVARFRAMRRIPAVVWRHRGNGAVLARSSQPEVGWLGWRSSEDERLLAALAATAALDGPPPHHRAKLLIVDARSYTSAVTNRARGGGCECPQYYPSADIQFMCLPNIHNVRKSFHQLRQLASEPGDQTNWHGSLERTLWLQYISNLGRTAEVVARALQSGRAVLVHCSDGWDRTPQVVAAAQLLLDPYYRTIEGFRVLIEREWLDFGHKFADRCGHNFGPEDPNERSPIFLQWLDLVHQIMLQYPCSFEFTQAYLIKLVTHAHSCMFGTFLCNSARERKDAAHRLASVWPLLASPLYINHLYAPPHPHDQVLWPDYSVRSLSFWWSLFVGSRSNRDVVPHPPQHHITNGVLSKTRSCDNLMNEADKPSTQRRCSDPSLFPDPGVSLNLGRDDSSDQTDLSTSASDLTPASSRNDDQTEVDGIHMNHFENGISSAGRDITSNSSSLERELAGTTAYQEEVNHGPSETHQSQNNNTTTTTEDTTLYFDDNYADVNGSEPANTSSRVRNISITWRSVSESSHQTDSSAGFDITDVPIRQNSDFRSALNDFTNHNINDSDITEGIEERVMENVESNELEVNHNESEVNSDECDSKGDESRNSSVESNGLSQGDLVGHGKMDEDAVKLLEVELGNLEVNGCGSEDRWLTSSCTSTETVCGGNVGGYSLDVDGLPAPHSPVQARLHQIIAHQKLVVEDLHAQLRAAHAALRATSPPNSLPSLNGTSVSTTNHVMHAIPPPPINNQQMCPNTMPEWSDAVEVGVEASWVPDAAAARCQACRNHFWLARRRHHCRVCGGIFCSSCSWVGSSGDGGLRVCRICRARR